jgi:hypothetical protein
MATARQIEANRRNAKKSTGPRTQKGKERSRLNALKHGNRAVAVLPVLPHEDPKALARRVQEWTDDLQPATAMECDLIACAARLSWVLERAEKAEVAQLAQRIEEAQENAAGSQTAQVRKLAWDLFSLGLVNYKSALRTCSGTDPAAIVGWLESSAEGCRWLLEQWGEQQRALRLGSAWTLKRLVRLVRLLGKEGTDVAWEGDLNAAVLAADVLKPGLAKEFWTLRLRAIPSGEDRLEEPDVWRELAPARPRPMKPGTPCWR